MANITRKVILEMTGTPADGKVRTLDIPADRRYAEVGLGGPKVNVICTGTVRWEGNDAYEVWVPADRIGEWRLLEDDPPADTPKEPPYT